MIYYALPPRHKAGPKGNPATQKAGPEKGPAKLGGIRKTSVYLVGWTEDPYRQGLGGWVKLPVEDISTNRQLEDGGSKGRARGPNRAIS
jgi:hypothetical protein